MASNDSRPVEAYFAGSVRTTPPTSGPAVMVRPTADSFNDFGRRYRTMLLVLDTEGTTHVLQQRLMFADHDSTADALQEVAADGMVRTDAVKRSFCSLLGSEDEYARLVQVLGREVAREALKALHDINALGDDEAGKAASALAQTESFTLGILRDAEVYTSYRRGRRHLTGSSRARVSDAAVTFGGAFRVGAFRHPLEVTFDFEPDAFLRDRMAVVVGPNGMGKSSILAGIVDAARSGRTQEEQADWADYLAPPPAFNKVLVVDSSGSTRFPRSLEPGERLNYTYLTQSNPADTGLAVTLALIDVLRDPEPIFRGGRDTGPASRKALLRDVLERLHLWESLYLPLRIDAPPINGARSFEGIRCLPVRTLGGEKNSLLAFQYADQDQEPLHVRGNAVRRLSSGELMFFRLAVLIVAAVERGTLCLIDEPENHLHPRFISELMSLLDRVLKPTSSCAIIATHSPFVVRECPRRRVRVLYPDEGRIVAGPPRLQTFGASVEAISKAVFADGEDARLHEELLDNWIEDKNYTLADLDRIVRQFGGDLNPETLSYISEHLRPKSASR